MKPLAIDLFCGLGGWTEGLLAEGYDVVGFDCEQHVYGEHRYPAQLVLQDVLTIHGRQFKDADLIVASPPCQAYSYRAMPWKRAKALPPPDNSLFEACFRIQREAQEAAGRFIPLVVENVVGAQKWVGRARWHYGSFYLWGDVPALMPFTNKRFHKIESPHLHLGDPRSAPGSIARLRYEARSEGRKVSGLNWSNFGKPDYKAEAFNTTAGQQFKTRDGGSWFAVSHNKVPPSNPVNDSIKGSNGGWFNDHKRAGKGETGYLSRSGSKSTARKAASAAIAKIPLPLARHIAHAWKPQHEETA